MASAVSVSSVSYEEMAPPAQAAAFLNAVNNNDQDLAYNLMEQIEIPLNAVTLVDKNTAYHLAAQNNFVDLMWLLLDRHDFELNEDILNMRNKRGRTAAFEAAVRGHFEIVNMLWERGANLDDIFDDSFRTAQFDWRNFNELKKIFWHYDADDHLEAGREFWLGVFDAGSEEAKIVDSMSSED